MSTSTTRAAILVATVIAAMLSGCATEGGDAGPGWAPPGGWDNLEPVPNPNDEAAPQPFRQNPYAVALTADGRTALVTLRGSELEPDHEVAIVDVPRKQVRARLHVGSRPHAVAIHPSGDVAVVLSQFSRHAAVIDLRKERVVGALELGYYAAELTFSADGQTMFVSNRATDTVQRWRVGRVAASLTAELDAEAPAGVNPRALALSPDGAKLYATDDGGLGVRVFDAANLEELTFIFLNAPVFDVAPIGPWMMATTLNDTQGLPCEDDGDYIGTQGDGVFPIVTDRTCSRGFADIQNELAFIDPGSDEVVIRYTSDSAQISEADREGDHPEALRKVYGALPNRIAVLDPERALVTMSASNELAEVRISGSPPALTMDRAWDVGFAPEGVAALPGGTVAVVANRLGETVSIVNLVTDERVDIPVGNVSPPFPSTQAEIGEFFFFGTAPFSTDGDMSCSHCHPDAENDGKAWGVDVVLPFGRRSVMPMRNLFETKPLLIEGVFDENDFSLEMEGISFRRDFHETSYTLQVQRRDEFYRQVSRELIGREVGFDEMVLAVGAFLVVEPRLLPSPFSKDTPQVERGRALYFRPDVGCAACHPPPTFASPEVFEGVVTLGRYGTPAYNLDPDISVKFIENALPGFFNANSLRGLWDRRGALFHDGRARTIRETILTPGHPCLLPGERAFNEFEGQVDTNGGISHLTCEQIDDLVAFLKTID
jgi:DNA-binding beta-propeller fold protein YncE